MNDLAPRINGSFSLQLPTLQLVIDQTSLGLFKECPRKYYYRMVEGWTTRSTNVHLSFGSWFHASCETYEHAKANGQTHQQALRAAVRYAMTATWDHVLGKPWNSENKDKNRYSLIRTVVWYLDAYGANSNAKTLILHNGKPAVELTFRFEPVSPEDGSLLVSRVTGEQIWFSGHLDSVVDMQGSNFISDRKTTSRRLGPQYFAAYTPDNQFSMYTYAGRQAFDIPVAGVICDAVQVNQYNTQFERQIIYRTEGQIREWFNHTKFWINLMGAMAEQNAWPQNDKACFLCPYRPVCARDPAARQQWLEADYIRDLWDPSVKRGE